MEKIDQIPKILRTQELERIFSENRVKICGRYCGGVPGSEHCSRVDNGAGYVHIGKIEKCSCPRYFCYKVTAVKEAT